jgi:protein KRI1
MAAVLAETDGMGAGGGDEKPTWDDDIDVDDIVGKEAPNTSAAKERKRAKKKEKKRRTSGDGENAVDVDEMDADASKASGSRWDEVEWDGTEETRKRVLDQYMEELYELEFNDMVRPHRPLVMCPLLMLYDGPCAQVAGKPTHFRYVPVAKTAFGLAPAEILLADDKDLNEYVGLKKLAPYRKQRDTWDAKRHTRLREFKTKVSERLGEAGADVVAGHLAEGERKTKKRKGKKERTREKAAVAPEQEARDVETKATDSPRPSNKHAKRHRDDEEDESVGNIAVSEPIKKKRRRQKRVGKSTEQAVV